MRLISYSSGALGTEVIKVLREGMGVNFPYLYHVIRRSDTKRTSYYI